MNQDGEAPTWADLDPGVQHRNDTKMQDSFPASAASFGLAIAPAAAQVFKPSPWSTAKLTAALSAPGLVPALPSDEVTTGRPPDSSRRPTSGTDSRSTPARADPRRASSNSTTGVFRTTAPSV